MTLTKTGYASYVYVMAERKSKTGYASYVYVMAERKSKTGYVREKVKLDMHHGFT
jgi:hypothetical protein